MPEPKIYVSQAAYFPYAAWKPRVAADWAYEAGYAGLQVLPTRGMLSRPNLSLPVKYLENVWYIDNPDSCPTLIDRPFFPDLEASQDLFYDLRDYPGVREIAHEFKSGSMLVEPHHGLWMSPDDIVSAAHQRNARLVLDTWHLREPLNANQLHSFPGGTVPPVSFLGTWQDAVRILGPLTNVVHVQTRSYRELMATLDNEPTELAQMVELIREHTESPDWVVEVTIGIRGFNPFELIGMHRRMRQWLALKLME